MRDSAFTISDAARVLEHPDTPAAYVEWAELLALLCAADRIHLANAMQWSYPAAKRTLGASWKLFEGLLGSVGEELVDRWMAGLASTPVEDFIDHHVPFMRNLAGATHNRKVMVRTFLDLYDSDRGRGEQLPPKSIADRRLYEPWPTDVHLEITRSCNFSCTMCSSRTGGHVPAVTMPLPMFGELVRVLGPHAESIRVNGYGETAIVPGLDGYLDCLDEFAFAGRREIITNLSAPDAVYRDLAERGFVIMVSWDATNAEMFEDIRRGADFAAMLQRLRRLGGWLAHEPARLVLLCTIQQKNLDEIVPLVRQASDVGAGLVIFNMVNEEDGSPWMTERFVDVSSRFERAAREADELGVKVRIPDHIGPQRLRLRGVRPTSGTFCDRPWRDLVVRWDGEATVCNMFNPFSYGTLRPPGPPRDMPTRLKRLWNGPNAALFRRLINTDHRCAYCNECYYLHG